jgi:hypothetical protein
MDDLVTPNDAPDPVADPVAAQRLRIARLVGIAKRIGYLGLVVAIVAFVVSAITGFPDWAVGVTIGGLVVGIIVLPVPIILGYGIRAAEREERGGGRFH